MPIAIAFVAGAMILDDARLQPNRVASRPPFDWWGAALSGAAIVLVVITINNPLGRAWTSPLMLASVGAAAALFLAFVRWEIRVPSPMLDLTLFRNRVFSLAVLTRFLGFMGMSVTRFLMPIYLISLRGLEEGTAGAILFVISFGMGIAAQGSGRLSDRFGPRPFSMIGFVILAVTSLPLAFLTQVTPLTVVMALLFVNGFGMGLWNVPNNSVIMGSVPPARLGVVSALANLTRNVGNVIGQAVASGVIVAIMVANGFDIPLNEIAEVDGAGQAFIDGWRVTYLLVTGYAVIGFVLSSATRPPREEATASTQAPASMSR